MVIRLTRGDDLSALGEEVNIVLETSEDINLTNYKAKFQLGDFQQEWSDITSKKLTLDIPRSKSKDLPLGFQKGALKIYDENNLAKTVYKNIQFLIEPEVVKNA